MKKITRTFLCLAVLLTITEVSSVSADFPDNWPLTGSLDVHDPSIIKEGDIYYIFATGYDDPDIDYPVGDFGIKVKRSYDGLEWTNIGSVYSTYPSWADTYVPGHEDNIWAPDITYYNGTYYLYYAVSRFGHNDSAIGVATATSLSSPNWVDHGVVIYSTEGVDDYNCIDPNLVFDQAGDPWLAFGSFWGGIQIVRLNSDLLSIQSGAAIKQLAWRDPVGAIEGADIVYRNGYYYLFASVDVCCQGIDSTYKIIYGRSTTIDGTYYDKDGVDMNNSGCTYFDVGNEFWIGPGGQSLLGTDVMAHHAYDASNDGAPTLMIKNVHWDAWDWPFRADRECNSDSDCSDGFFCNGTETCNLSYNTCEWGSAPCTTGEVCNEETDQCDSLDIIIDNADGSPLFTTNGTWSSSTWASGYYGVDYMHGGEGDSSKTASFNPDILVSGSYDVYMYYSADATTRPAAAPVTISYADGCTDSLTVNQQINGGMWNLLGTYDFYEDIDGQVTIQGAGEGYTIADAVRFLWVGDPTGEGCGECGNGTTEPPETCDDGNLIDGDCCSSDCQIEPDCTVEEDIIIDNADGSPLFTTNGTWTSSTYASGYYGVDYVHGGEGDSSKTASFNPDISVSGSYEVYMYYSADVTRPTAAPVTISYADGCTDSLTVNQQINGGMWNLLGTYDFYEDIDGQVTIQGAGEGYTIADAVRFLWVGDPTGEGCGECGNGTTEPPETCDDGNLIDGDCCSSVCQIEPDCTVEEEIIIDNLDGSPAFSLLGSWSSSTYAPGYWGSDYVHSGNDGDTSKEAVFAADIQNSGAFDVYIWYSADVTRPTDVPVHITYDSGCELQVTVDQQTNGSQWFYLGTFDFYDDMDGNVAIQAAAVGYTIADAVRFDRVGDTGGVGQTCP